MAQAARDICGYTNATDAALSAQRHRQPFDSTRAAIALRLPLVRRTRGAYGAK